MKTVVAGALLILAAGLATAAEEKSITLPPDDPFARLKPGPGSEVAQRQCQLCHSTDYIVTQPHGDAKQWQGVVTKMMKVYGAPVTDAEAKTIVEYLSTAYGK
jgi:sulfite dehydrogenase (cytochrome) subunit B